MHKINWEVYFCPPTPVWRRMLRRKLCRREQTPRWRGQPGPVGQPQASDMRLTTRGVSSTPGVWGAYTRFLKLLRIPIFIFTSDRSVFINILIIATQGQIRSVFLMPRQLIDCSTLPFFKKSKGLSLCSQVHPPKPTCVHAQTNGLLDFQHFCCCIWTLRHNLDVENRHILWNSIYPFL